MCDDRIDALSDVGLFQKGLPKLGILDELLLLSRSSPSEVEDGSSRTILGCTAVVQPARMSGSDTAFHPSDGHSTSGRLRSGRARRTTSISQFVTEVLATASSQVGVNNGPPLVDRCRTPRRP